MDSLKVPPIPGSGSVPPIAMPDTSNLVRTLRLLLLLVLVSTQAEALCTPTAERLCLLDGRFSVSVEATSHLGHHRGRAIATSDRWGAFHFFQAGNYELIVKMIDGRQHNGTFWVFYGPLTTLDFDLRVEDHVLGQEKIYRQRGGQPESRFDTSAFFDPLPASGERASSVLEMETPPDRVASSSTAGPCLPSPTTLCLLEGRVEVRLIWRGIDGVAPEAPVAARALSDSSGLFWFFHPANPEVVIKMVDGRAANRALWTFSTALTSLPYDLVLRDTLSGQTRRYRHASFAADTLVDTLTFVESVPVPPAPEILEPAADGVVLSAFDLRFEVGPMALSDPSHPHYCTDFEIWTAPSPPAPPRQVWSAPCQTDQGRYLATLQDGTWQGVFAGYRSLRFDTTYRVRARYRDATGHAGDWADRHFTVDDQLHRRPFKLARSGPAADWLDESGRPLRHPAGGGVVLRLETEGTLLGHWDLLGAEGSRFSPGLELAHPAPLRLVLHNDGSQPVELPASVVVFDHVPLGMETDRLFLPALTLAADESRFLWPAHNGSTFYGSAGSSTPQLEVLAQYLPNPWRPRVAGYETERVADGLLLPVQLAFPRDPDPTDDRLLYVAELQGTIWIIRRDGSRELFAEELLNFDPRSDFPGGGEVGMAGMALDPVSGDLFVAMAHAVDLSSGIFSARIVRLGVDPSGRHDGTKTTVFDSSPETLGTVHQIGDLNFGPEGHLFAHLGDGGYSATSYDLGSYLGKILRMDPTGAPDPDNPFYDPADGIDARDFVYAYGFRNPFAGDWSERLGKLVIAENGPSVDRLAVVDEAAAYGWDADQDGVGTDQDIAERAVHLWGPPPHAPAGLAFVQPSAFGGSGFPEAAWHQGFVTEYGRGLVPGGNVNGKRISSFRFTEEGSLVAAPEPWVEYVGDGRATLVALAAGPDGLYFAEFFVDDPTEPNPVARASRLWRLVAETTP